MSSPKTVKVLRYEKQNTRWLHSTGDSTFLWGKKKKKWNQVFFLFLPLTVWPLTRTKPGLAGSMHHLLVMWKHIRIHIQLSRMYTAAQRRGLWCCVLSGHAYVSKPGVQTRTNSENMILQRQGNGWLIPQKTSTYMSVMNQCTQESIKVL